MCTAKTARRQVVGLELGGRRLWSPSRFSSREALSPDGARCSRLPAAGLYEPKPPSNHESGPGRMEFAPSRRHRNAVRICSAPQGGSRLLEVLLATGRVLTPDAADRPRWGGTITLATQDARRPRQAAAVPVEGLPSQKRRTSLPCAAFGLKVRSPQADCPPASSGSRSSPRPARRHRATARGTSVTVCGGRRGCGRTRAVLLCLLFATRRADYLCAGVESAGGENVE